MENGNLFNHKKIKLCILHKNGNQMKCILSEATESQKLKFLYYLNYRFYYSVLILHTYTSLYDYPHIFCWSQSGMARGEEKGRFYGSEVGRTIETWQKSTKGNTELKGAIRKTVQGGVGARNQPRGGMKMGQKKACLFMC